MGYLKKERWLFGEEEEQRGYSSLYLSPTTESGWVKEMVCKATSQPGLLSFVNARTGSHYCLCLINLCHLNLGPF